MSIKRTILVGVAIGSMPLMLHACAPADPEPTAGGNEVEQIANIGEYEVYHFCDRGRAVYMSKSNGSSIQVVPNASECQGF